jgi:hypothetical protein
MSKIRGYEAQEKQTTTSKMKKLCTKTNKHFTTCRWQGSFSFLKLQNLLHEILAIIGIFSSFFLAATGDVGLRV